MLTVHEINILLNLLAHDIRAAEESIDFQRKNQYPAESIKIATDYISERRKIEKKLKVAIDSGSREKF